MNEDTVSRTNSSTKLMAGATPFTLSGGPIGVLIIHGYGGSPGGFRDFAGQFQGLGYTVMAMRIAGHGITPKALAQTSPAAWEESVQLAITELQKSCQSIVLVGISFGGDLALAGAATHQGIVKAIITLNTPLSYRIPLWKRWLIRAMSPWRPYYRKPHLTPEESEWNTRVGSLSHWPILGILSTERFIKEKVRPALPKIQQPIFVLSTEDDPYVDRRSAEDLLSSLGSPIKELSWITARGHRPLRDPELLKDIVHRIHVFLKKVLPE